MLAPAPTALDTYAAIADVVEGRVPIERVPYRLWTSLSDADQAAALAARRRAEDEAGKLDYFRARHGVDLRDRSTILDLAERMAQAEAEFAYYAGADDATGDSRGVVTAAGRAPAGSLDTWQQLPIGDSGGRAKVDRVPPGQGVAPAGDRVQRYDRSKVSLAAAVRDASGDRWPTDPAGSILLDAMAGRLDGCRKVKAYRDACGAWFARPESCHVRLCPDCERSRSARLVRRLGDVAATMARPAFWTFTIPNVPAGQLGDGIDVLLAAFAELRERALFRGGQCRGAHDDPAELAAPRRSCRHAPHRRARELAGTCQCARCTVSDARGSPGLDVGPCRARVAGHRCGRPADDHDGAGHPYRAGRRTRGCRRCRHAPVRGGVYAVEVTYSARGDWHPHLHALVDAPFILQAEMRDAWRAVTCDAIRRRELRGTRSRRATGTRRELVESPASAGEGVSQGPLAGTGRPPALPRCPHRADAEGRSIDGCRGASMVWVEGVRGAPGSPERLAAIRETVKYVTKGILGRDGGLNPALGPADLGDLLLALRGRRLVAGWGTLRHVTDDPEDADDGAAGERLAGPDVLPELRGLPVTCPVCRQVADWQLPILVDRRDCRPLAGGALVWHPPPVTHGPT